MPPAIDPQWCVPHWSVPGVTAFTTTRSGGVSAAPWDSLNLGPHVGDAPAAVAANRAALRARLPDGTQIQWLQQVHSSTVVEAAVGDNLPTADGCWVAEPGIACAVMTADCLPVLFSAVDGMCVAAAHAGWRGLLSGILEETVTAMGVAPQRLQAWLGPAISVEAFEVGPEVRDAFMASGADASAFSPAPRPGHWMADLYQLARQRLAAFGLADVSGGHYCTYRQSSQFFSYRRDGQTGRMASLILINP